MGVDRVCGHRQAARVSSGAGWARSCNVPAVDNVEVRAVRAVSDTVFLVADDGVALVEGGDQPSNR